MDDNVQYITVNVSRVDQDWSPKDDGKKRLVWRDEEVIALLKLMQEQTLTNRLLSHSQLSELLAKPLKTMGINRSVYQIRSKLKNLRKSYLQCKKHGCTPVALKECPYYDILNTIYENSTNKELLDSDNENSQENLDKFVWSSKEIEKMLSIIEDLNLAHEISLTSFSLGALRLISKAMKLNGFNRNVDHVKTALSSLKASYIECKKNILQGDVQNECLFFEDLDEIWGSDEIPECTIKNKDTGKLKSDNDDKTEKGKNEFWSEEETIVLLMSIAELDIADDAFQCSDFALSKLYEVLQDSGYERTKGQISRKLENLKQSFLKEQHSNSAERTFRRFPFYHLYENLFGSFFSNSDLNEEDEEDEEEGDRSIHPLDKLPSIDTTEKKKQNRSPAWSEEETILTLALIQELDLVQEIKDRLTLDLVSKLVSPLAEHGFCRTAGQIKIKLKNLRTSYQKCHQAGCTPQALTECPFYSRLHAIFQKAPQSKKLDTVRRLEPLNHNYANMMEASFDHSYVCTLNGSMIEKSSESSKKVKFSAKRQEKGDVWLPVETITDESTSEIPQEYEDFQQNVEYVEDENDSDISHTLGFEEFDETEYYETHKTSDKEISDYVEEPVPSIKEQIFTDAEMTIPVIDVETHTKEQSQETIEISESSKSNEIKSNTAKTKPALKRKYFPSSDKKSFDKNKFIRKSDPESPFTDLLGRNNVSNNNINKAQESIYVKSMRMVMTEVLTHEKWIQEQHHIWMERQFEIQRKHDRDQRELLLNELRELRSTITSALLK